MIIYEILSESQRSAGIQIGLNQLAGYVVDNMLNLAMGRLKQNHLLTPQNFGVFAFRSISKDNYNHLIEPIKQFVMALQAMKFWFEETNGSTIAEYYPRKGFQSIIYYDRNLIPALHAWVRASYDKNIFEPEVKKKEAQEEISKVKSYILHELTHAFDDWQSRGKFTANKRADLHKEAPQDRATYLKQPHEINAHFRQALRLVDPKKSWNEFLYDFRTKFNELDDLPPSYQKQILRRLATFWHDMRSTT